MMSGMREKLIRFMSGRYGMDKLYYVLLVIYLILLLLNVFVPSVMITILGWGVLIYAFFRVFSRNVYKRYAENQKFLKLWNRIVSWFKLSAKRFKELKTKVYHRCPHCKTMLRLPRKKGKHTVSCPKCHRDLTMKVHF